MRSYVWLLILVFTEVICDECTDGNVCDDVRLCCPQGQAYLEGDGGEEEGSGLACRSYEDGVADDATEEFQCASGDMMPAFALFGHDYKAEVIPEVGLKLLWGDGLEGNDSGEEIFNSGHYCRGYLDMPDYSDEEESSGDVNIQPVMMICFQEDEPRGHSFTNIFYPIAVFISAFFFLVTIIVYFLLKDLRKNLFGKLTFGFLINVFIGYILTGIHKSLDTKNNREILDSKSCIFLGYLIQHFFIAFFFWMNAMAIDITKTFSNTLSSRKSTSSQKKALIANVSYAQGLPIIITIITICMDSLGDKEKLIIPHMGHVTCFLGTDYNPDSSFASTPQFVYFFLVQSILLAANTVCFLITVYNLIKHWLQVKNMDRSVKNGMKSQFGIVMKLMVIMGIPWILEVASAAVAHSEKLNDAWELNLILDIVNLLTGVLIFIALVCKSQVLKGLKKIIGDNLTSSTESQQSRRSNGTSSRATFSSRLSNKSMDVVPDSKSDINNANFIKNNLSVGDDTVSP